MLADTLAAYCPDLEEWPARWMYEERDLAPGQHLVEVFTPFLQHLLASNLSRKTLRRHRDNIWLLGGAIISSLHRTPDLRKLPMRQVVSDAVDDEGGPLISGGEPDEEQLSFDVTCRKFHRFLRDSSAGG